MFRISTKYLGLRDVLADFIIGFDKRRNNFPPRSPERAPERRFECRKRDLECASMLRPFVSIGRGKLAGAGDEDEVGNFTLQLCQEEVPKHGI